LTSADLKSPDTSLKLLIREESSDLFSIDKGSRFN